MVDFGDFQRDRASQIALHSVQLTAGNERLNKLPGVGSTGHFPGGVITVIYEYNNLKLYIYNKHIALHFVCRL